MPSQISPSKAPVRRDGHAGLSCGKSLGGHADRLGLGRAISTSTCACSHTITAIGPTRGRNVALDVSTEPADVRTNLSQLGYDNC